MEKRKVEKVVQGNVKTRKKSLGAKFAETFVAEDIANVRDYILVDVIIPSIKNAIMDTVSKGVEKLLYGDVRINKQQNGKTIFNYNSISSSKPSSNVKPAAKPQARYNYDEIVLDTRSEAMEVLENLSDLVKDYGMASIADLYDLVGIPSAYTDNKYGWVDLSGASVVSVRDGFLLKLPKVTVID